MAANTPTVHELPPSSDIVIVGAGPAGLATALVLASKKIPFVIVDALKEGQNESRAAVVHSYTLEVRCAVSVPFFPRSSLAPTWFHFRFLPCALPPCITFVAVLRSFHSLPQAECQSSPR